MKRSIITFFHFWLLGIVLPIDSFDVHSPVSKIPDIQDDGPYVFYKKNMITVKYILDSSGTKWVKTDTSSLDNKKGLSLRVGTDIPGETFSVQLKDQLQNENSEYENVSKIFAISDMEGDFTSFRQLLQAGGVIDENYNWIFGNGHLVLAGDFLDRGSHVIEVLWLIYSLEEKAKTAGGYVHYILGNHEIMNLSGDLRYVNPKYFANSKLIHEPYEKFFNKNSELGRWLCTKNIVEKVGKLLFVHGGISDEVNGLNISVSKINKEARPYYTSSTDEYMNQDVSTVLSTKVGPYWYRGYYNDDHKVTMQQMNNILSKFDIIHVVTGHTIAADTISQWYNGKVINLDTHDNRGKSEALLIEGEKYYRVDTKGQKFLIMQ